MELVQCLEESYKGNTKTKAQGFNHPNQNGIAVLSSKTPFIESYSNRTRSRFRTIRERKQCQKPHLKDQN